MKTHSLVIPVVLLVIALLAGCAPAVSAAVAPNPATAVPKNQALLLNLDIFR